MLDNRHLSTNSSFVHGAQQTSLDRSTSDLDSKISTNNININLSFSADRVLLRRLYSLQEENKFLVDCFVNQRKVYRYYKAYSELEVGEISQKKFDEVENSCVLTLKKSDKKELISKLEYLYSSLKRNNPEELEYINDDDLADILLTSKIKLKHILKDIKRVAR